MVGLSPKRGEGATLAALRRSTAADHESVDALIAPGRLVEVGYYVAVVRALIECAEIVEVTLPRIPRGLCRQGLSASDVSKRVAIDAESSFLDELAAPRPVRRPPGGVDDLLAPGPPAQATMVGLLYVYVGSALGGLHLLRVARTAPWWRHEREHLLFRPYGCHFADRWRAVLDALERLDPEETNAAVGAAKAGFDLHRRSLTDHLSAGPHR
ncbi:hypothetical protein HLY00_4386 [Mycolicibacterium hippocampi]|uniref:Heme oxygenase n=1 Tax=Mycolicibacterium hippocampi TaxID=659824 RepID=A0A850PUT8_9MYCO|nr:hypothetical protein [Mycolicibacterium hippocampi]